MVSCSHLKHYHNSEKNATSHEKGGINNVCIPNVFAHQNKNQNKKCHSVCHVPSGPAPSPTPVLHPGQTIAYSILPVPNREESPPRKKRVPNHDFVQTGGSGEVWGPSIGGSFLGQIFSSCSRQKWPKPCRGGQQTHTPYHLLLRGSGVFYWQFEHFQHLFYKKNTMGRFGPHCAHDH